MQKAFQLRFDDAGKQIYMWPKDIVDNTILAWTSAPRRRGGYAGAAPTDATSRGERTSCIEIAQVNGANGGQTNPNAGFATAGRDPWSSRPDVLAHDIGSRNARRRGNIDFEFAAELLNALNHANFTPVSGIQTGHSARR